jgi:two-component system chemotaxis response regulator CheB
MSHETMRHDVLKRDIVVIGGSSGALQTLKFIADLPATFPAAIFIVLHTAPDGPALLPDILRRYAALPVEHARDGEAVVPGRIYVGLPDYHLVVRPAFVQVVRGPKENLHRPSIDVLFRSAAGAYGPRVIGVILSGKLDDGSSGLAAVRGAGGLGIVQDPSDALAPDMPQNALAYAGADLCVPRSRLASVLMEASTEMFPQPILAPVSPERREEHVHKVSMKRDNDTSRLLNPSTLLNFSCPECGGVLRQVDEPTYHVQVPRHDSGAASDTR